MIPMGLVLLVLTVFIPSAYNHQSDVSHCYKGYSKWACSGGSAEYCFIGDCSDGHWLSGCGSVEVGVAINRMAHDCRVRFGQDVDYVADSLRFCNCEYCNTKDDFYCEIPGYILVKPPPPPPPPPQVVDTTTTTTTTIEPTTSTTTTITTTATTETTTIFQGGENGDTGKNAIGRAITFGWFIVLGLLAAAVFILLDEWDL